MVDMSKTKHAFTPNFEVFTSTEATCIIYWFMGPSTCFLDLKKKIIFNLASLKGRLEISSI
jgi:hypothetical protein